MFKLAVLMVMLVALFALVVAAVMPHLNFCTGQPIQACNKRANC